jgi:hypothetical protein
MSRPLLLFASVATAALLAGCCACGGRASEKAKPVSITPGPDVRQPAIVRFDAPWKSATAVSDGQGRTFGAQQDGDGKYMAVLPGLEPGKPVVLRPSTASPPLRLATVREVAGSRIAFADHLGPFLTYQAAAGPFPREDIPARFRRGGYIQNLLSPSGLRVTDDFPTNHVHHHGIWSPWTKTKFEGREPDFWNMGDSKGRVDFVAVDATWSGPVHAGIRSRHDFIDMLAKPEKTALHETWDLRVYALPDASIRMADLSLEQTCATASPLYLPEYRYGGLGFRGNASWNGAANCFFLTSEGVTNRVAAHATRARWCWIGGYVDGRLTGVVIMDHPQNFRFPQPMRIHPDEPFFCYAPPLLGDFAITPDSPYRARYRIITFDGIPDSGRIEGWWRDFASPAEARPAS